MNSFREYKVEKCRNFGFTFSVIFLIISIYDIYYINTFYKAYLVIATILFFVTLFKPLYFRFFGYYWERFGVYLGIFFSPVILFLVYLFTIIPINLFVRILQIDLIQKNYVKKQKSYWEIRKNNEINFKDQF